MEFNPDLFRFTKAELTQKMDLFNDRLQRNPKVNGKVKRYGGLNLALIKSRFVSEQDLRYSIQLMDMFISDLKSLQVRRDDPALAKLNPLFEKAVDEKIMFTPEEIVEKPKIVIDFKQHLKYGAMKEA